VDRTAVGQVFPEYFSFPCQSFIPLVASQSSPSIIQGWYSKPINGHSNSGLGFTSTTYINKKNKENNAQSTTHNKQNSIKAELVA
jgi:hypothetical protein